MKDCTELEPRVTPYVDGHLGQAERQAVDAHLRACPSCHSRVAAERTIHDLLQARRGTLRAAAAPETLLKRCCAQASRAAAPSWRARLTPYALAAGLVLIVGGAFVYQLTDRSSRVLAAELAADHVKCFAANRAFGVEHSTAPHVEQWMASAFGVHAQLPAGPAEGDLDLVAARPCLYGEGRVAHIMYRHNGQDVSVFVLPHTSRPEEVVDVLGHEAAIWSSGDRTIVVLAREPREVRQMATYVQAAFH